MAKVHLRKSHILLILVLALAVTFTLSLALASADSSPEVYMELSGPIDDVYQLQVKLYPKADMNLKMFFAVLSYDMAKIQPVEHSNAINPGANITPVDGGDAISAMDAYLTGEDFMLSTQWRQPEGYSRMAVVSTLAYAGDGAGKAVSAGNVYSMFSFSFKLKAGFTDSDINASTFILEGDRGAGSLVSQLYAENEITTSYGAQCNLSNTDYYLANDASQTRLITLGSSPSTALKTLAPAEVTMWADYYRGGLIVNISDPNPYYAVDDVYGYTLTLGGKTYVDLHQGDNYLPLSADIVAGTEYTATGLQARGQNYYSAVAQTLTGVTATAAAAPTVSVSEATVLKGNAVEVTVSLAEEIYLTDFTIVITPDANYSTYFSGGPTWVLAPALSGATVTVNPTTYAATISYDGTELTEIAANGVLCTLTYTAKADAAATTAPIALTPSFAQPFGYFGGGSDMTAAPVGVAGGLNVMDVVLGDLDGNMLVNVNDAVALLEYAAELTTLTSSQMAAADVNHDGLVNVNDAVRILEYAAELITEF